MTSRHNIDFSIDPFTGRDPSFCFVDLASNYAAQAIETMQGQDIRGRPIRLNHNSRSNSKASWPRPTAQHRGRNPKGTTPADINDGAFVFNRWTRDDAKDHWIAPHDEDRRLFIGGLPRISTQRALDLEMRQLFRGRPLQAVSKLIYPHPSKDNLPGEHHYCFADLASAEAARAACDELNGTLSPHGGAYRVQMGNLRKPTKLLREQLGGLWPTESKPVQRNLHGNWRERPKVTTTPDGLIDGQVAIEK